MKRSKLIEAIFSQSAFVHAYYAIFLQPLGGLMNPIPCFGIFIDHIAKNGNGKMVLISLRPKF
jgi:hypothetical protein